MKKTTLIAALAALTATVSAVEINGKLIHAFALTESPPHGIDHNAIGDGGKARGAWQMHFAAWWEASASLKSAGYKTAPHAIGAHDPALAHTHAKEYMAITHKRLAKRMGREPNAFELYAAWNLGVGGFAELGFKIDACPSATRNGIQRLKIHLTRCPPPPCRPLFRHLQPTPWRAARQPRSALCAPNQ